MIPSSYLLHLSVSLLVTPTPGAAKFIRNGTILPLIWIEITANDFNDDILQKLYISTFGLDAIQQALKYGTLLVSVTTFSLIVAGVYFMNTKREEQQQQHQLEHSKSSAELEALNAPPGGHGNCAIVVDVMTNTVSHVEHRGVET